ncbi:MAG: D-glycero-alpha-D-manno-heptose-1,7-bisphosphate 7-phosphatase [Thermoplasmatota archaeon]
MFFDRDGVLVERRLWPAKRIDQLRVRPDAITALRKLALTPFEAIVVTNQPGVRLGIVRPQDLDSLHEDLARTFEESGAHIDAILAWRPGDDPTLRKPNPGLLRKAARERNLDLVGSWMIGDKRKDIEAGRAAGCRTILVNPAPSARIDGAARLATHRVPELGAAVDIILRPSATGGEMRESP